MQIVIKLVVSKNFKFGRFLFYFKQSRFLFANFIILLKLNSQRILRFDGASDALAI